MNADLGDWLVTRWAEWVAELAEHPLDPDEYSGLLECRDDLAEWLEVGGRDADREATDAADADFERLTAMPDGSTGRALESAWWSERLPVDPRWRDYLSR